MLPLTSMLITATHSKAARTWASPADRPKQKKNLFPRQNQSTNKQLLGISVFNLTYLTSWDHGVISKFTQHSEQPKNHYCLSTSYKSQKEAKISTFVLAAGRPERRLLRVQTWAIHLAFQNFPSYTSNTINRFLNKMKLLLGEWVKKLH